MLNQYFIKVGVVDRTVVRSNYQVVGGQKLYPPNCLPGNIHDFSIYDGRAIVKFGKRDWLPSILCIFFHNKCVLLGQIGARLKLSGFSFTQA